MGRVMENGDEKWISGHLKNGGMGMMVAGDRWRDGYGRE